MVQFKVNGLDVTMTLDEFIQYLDKTKQPRFKEPLLQDSDQRKIMEEYNAALKERARYDKVDTGHNMQYKIDEGTAGNANVLAGRRHG